ncbi:hypothetical protein A2U01_0073614, partial [Trifolium medium]|nr:hypothetical protein [Trifolium medium]
KFKKGRKKSEASTSQTKRPKGEKELESHPNASSSDEEDGTITEEPKRRVLKPSPGVGSKSKPRR